VSAQEESKKKTGLLDRLKARRRRQRQRAADRAMRMRGQGGPDDARRDTGVTNDSFGGGAG
jgi:hypothetical protein